MQMTVTNAMRTPNGWQIFEFDRTPYVYEKTSVDAYGNERVEKVYSIAGRKAEFNFMYPNGYYLPTIVESTERYTVVKAEVFANFDDLLPIGIAHARRLFNASDLRYGYAFTEQAETAAIGRALLNAGIGLGFGSEESKEDTAVENGGIAPIAEGSSAEGNSPEKAINAEYAALSTVVTSDAEYAGCTFAKVLGAIHGVTGIRNLLSFLIENGTEDEQVAATVLLAKYPAAPEVKEKKAPAAKAKGAKKADKKDSEPEGESSSQPVSETEASEASEAAPEATPVADEAPESTEPEYDPLAVVIETTESKTLKGNTFGFAVSLATKPEHFLAFLQSLVESGTEAEVKAATALLPEWEEKLAGASLD